MLSLELVTDTGKVLQIEVPEKASEVRLNKYIDLHDGYHTLTEWIREQGDQLYENRTYYAYRLGKLLSDFLGVDLIDILSLPASGLLDDSGELLPGVLKDHLSNITTNTDRPEVIDTLFTIFELIKHAVLDYEPRLVGEFTYKEETYEVPEIRILAMGQVDFPKLTVLQTIEALEVRRAASVAKEQATSALYTSYLHQLAVLCRKKGEVFDLDSFDSQVQSRIAHFKDIPMDIALNVVFFSQLILNNYLSEASIGSFSNLPHPAQELTLKF